MSTLFTHFFEKINQISPLEHDFTEVLEAIALKPKTLYFRGKLPENMSKNANQNSLKNDNQTSSKHAIQDNPKRGIQTSFFDQKTRPKTVAIVGSRHNTEYGREIAYQLAHTLARHGVVIVSGLAFGIDSISHQGCLDAGGTTVAVLGTRIDDIYPRNHISLAQQIIKQGGVIVSEYAPRDQKEAPLAPAEYIDKITGKRCINQFASFLYRNRLISGLSDVVVVVEAAEKSGSLNTATHALAQGKEVFAVPGNITSPYSQGCNKLIAQGAHPYTEPDDILRLLFPSEYVKSHQKAQRDGLIGDTDTETAILQALGDGLRNGEDIMKTKHLPPEVFNQTVTLLEIKGKIHALGLNHWGLV